MWFKDPLHQNHLGLGMGQPHETGHSLDLARKLLHSSPGGWGSGNLWGSKLPGGILHIQVGEAWSQGATGLGKPSVPGILVLFAPQRPTS